VRSVLFLLLKDLQILRRSPLQAGLLVAYPVLIAVLVGFAISPESGKPRVAFLNEVPSGSRVTVGGARLPAAGVEERICARVECVRVENRREARDEVSSGDALAALILPPDLVSEINSLSTPTPGVPEVEVLVNEENPIKAEAVNDRINTLLAEANLQVARRIASEGSRFIDLLVHGGDFEVVGQSIEILGLAKTAKILERVRPAVASGPLAESLDRVIRFAALSGENLDLAAPLLDRLAQPIEVDEVAVSGASPPLDLFAIAVAATLTLAFVTVLLVAGSLALEREENAFSRLTRSLVSPAALLVEKVALGIAVGLVVTLLLLGGMQIFVPLDWSRIGLWLAAILAGGAALGAAGAALGAAARELRAVSLLAFMVTLPVAFLALVPSGAVGRHVYDAIRVIGAVFPFKPALDAMTAALDPAGGSVGGPLIHLAILAVAYAILARVSLRRFGSV
jgi:ABC-2 type transport system permease protein